VTPFTVDGASTRRPCATLVRWQLAEGIHFLVPCGSTGEAATLSLDEQRRVVEIVGRGGGRTGAGGRRRGLERHARAVQQSRLMREAGATHLLHVSPAYSRPPQRGIEAHFRAIADAVPLRSSSTTCPAARRATSSPRRRLRLAEVASIVAGEGSVGHLAQITRLVPRAPGRVRGALGRTTR
jgi:4-hydroxy-tetrahydrodipicolinate synthase